MPNTVVRIGHQNRGGEESPIRLLGMLQTKPRVPRYNSIPARTGIASGAKAVGLAKKQGVLLNLFGDHFLTSLCQRQLGLRKHSFAQTTATL